MAKIKGVELKAVTNFKGHEGEPLTQGNIYMKGKKIGYYSDDSWGGCINIDIDSGYMEEFQKITKEYTQEDEQWFADELLISALVDLRTTEQEFNKAIKKGYKAVALIEHPQRYPQQILLGHTNTDRLCKWLDENGLDGYKVDGTYQLTMYTELNQFNIK